MVVAGVFVAAVEELVGESAIAHSNEVVVAGSSNEAVAARPPIEVVLTRAAVEEITALSAL